MINGTESTFAVPASGGGLLATIAGTTGASFSGQLVANDPDAGDTLRFAPGPQMAPRPTEA